MNETTIILLLSIPYFIDFMSGCFTYRLSIELLDLDEEREKDNQKYVIFIIFKYENILPKDKILDVNDVKCVVCLDKSRIAVLYKCGHRIMCIECAL